MSWACCTPHIYNDRKHSFPICRNRDALRKNKQKTRRLNFKEPIRTSLSQRGAKVSLKFRGCKKYQDSGRKSVFLVHRHMAVWLYRWVAGLSCDKQMVRRKCHCDVKINLNEIIVLKARSKSAPTFRTFLNHPHVVRKFRRFF